MVLSTRSPRLARLLAETFGPANEEQESLLAAIQEAAQMGGNGRIYKVGVRAYGCLIRMRYVAGITTRDALCRARELGMFEGVASFDDVGCKLVSEL